LHTWLDENKVLPGRGLALFSCQSVGLWRLFVLPVLVRDRLEVGDRPFLRPLAMILDEFESYLVVLVNAESARFIKVYLGTATGVAEIENSVPPATGDIVEKTGHRHDTYLHRHAKSVVSRVEAYWREHRVDWLVIGGVEEALGEVRDQLPKALHERLVAEMHLSPQADLNNVLEHVLKIEREQEQKLEVQRVEDLITTAMRGGAAVLRIEETLLAIVEGRVQLLIVDEEFAAAGWECPNCRFLGVTAEERCPLCGSAVNAEADVVEVALERLFEQDGSIEVLRAAQARQTLAQYGQIGAMLRYAYAWPQ
jgi:peptide chain release factor subunit 1